MYDRSDKDEDNVTALNVDKILPNLTSPKMLIAEPLLATFLNDKHDPSVTKLNTDMDEPILANALKLILDPNIS
jgi:hypothetical protein